MGEVSDRAELSHWALQEELSECEVGGFAEASRLPAALCVSGAREGDRRGLEGLWRLGARKGAC